MPLVRFPVRNEFGLGQPQLYKDANGEDPKAVLDGVAVAGLVGILRQLGDLAEFSAEVFHGLQEQVMTTASRSHKLKMRVQRIEASLPPLEKAILAQTSHIHFAYTAGCEWHPRIQNEKHHFIYNDLPRCIMNSYEECRDPPRLHLLDKFDTGGPGSCLKRYSDSTFFKKASGNAVEENVEKVQREKKARKSKKRRSSHRIRELSHSASMSNCSGRIQFSSPTANERTSPQNYSMTDVAPKSEIGEHSASLESRPGSGYVECAFDLHFSPQPEEEDSKEDSSGLMQDAGIHDSDYAVKQSWVVDENCSPSLSQEQIALSSSGVTWDEKAEIVESVCGYSDRDEIPEMTYDGDTYGSQSANCGNVNQMGILYNAVDTPKLISTRNEVDDIESEPDNYVDALNTIESESENDIEFQTKRAVEHSSNNINSNDREDGVYTLEANKANNHLPTNESHAEANIFINDEESRSLPDAGSSEGCSYNQMCQTSGKLSFSDHLAGSNLHIDDEVTSDSRLESVLSEPSPSSSGSMLSNLHDESRAEGATSVHESQTVQAEVSSKSQNVNAEVSGESQNVQAEVSSKSQNANAEVSGELQNVQAEVSSANSIKIWTNGGLLGLEPSKPPVFAASNDASQHSTVGSSRTISPMDQLVTSYNKMKEKPAAVVEKPEGTEKILSSNSAKDSHLTVHSDFQYKESGDSDGSDGLDLANSELRPHSVMRQGIGPPVNQDVKDTCIKSGMSNDDNSSGMFGLSRILLVNGFQRKVSLMHEGESESTLTMKTGALGQGIQMPETKPKAEFLSALPPLSFLTSSPPLEHMKISFNPIDGSETSKLKLKLPDGNLRHGSSRDMFPSFQLVPDPSIPLQDVVSESDDDTFCRSSPYMSDDNVSHYSDSNSEQWESDGIAECRNPELYDAFSKMSVMESVSNSLHAEDGMINNSIQFNGKLTSVASASSNEPLLDLPSFDAINTLSGKETKSTIDPMDLQHIQYPRSMPLPPPLPPVQWRPSKAFAEGEERQQSLTESSGHEFDLNTLVSINPQKSELLSTEQQDDEDKIAFRPGNKQLGQQKLNRPKETFRSVSDKGIDEKEDFLQQIRSKSFSLRPTAAAKTNVATGPTTNVQVTAILQKANAIRQAVASDDGGDEDNWSDS